MGKGKSNSVPDRWLAYTPVGKQITGTRFITFKVPLKLQISAKIPEDEQFMPVTLIEKVPNLKCIIDLTNTDRYYDSYEFTKHGIKYVKIACVGRELPSPSIIKRFFEVVDQFLDANPDGLIGVHCTHGVNRTGYFVCRYMIERMGMDTKMAMSLFNEARGHKMERYVYINDLERRYQCEDSSSQNWRSRPTLAINPSPTKKSKYYQNPLLKSSKHDQPKYFTVPTSKNQNFQPHNGVLEQQAQAQIPFGYSTEYYPPPPAIPINSQIYLPPWRRQKGQYSVNSSYHLQSSSGTHYQPQNFQLYMHPSSSHGNHHVTDVTESQQSYTHPKSTRTKNRQFSNAASGDQKKRVGLSKKPLVYDPKPSVRADNRKSKESTSQNAGNKRKYYQNPKLINNRPQLTSTLTHETYNR